MNILVIQTAFPGDCLLTLPLIDKINKKYTHSIIDVVSIPATKDIFKLSMYINNIYVLDKRNAHKSILEVIKFSKELKQNKYDLVISPHRSVRSTLISWIVNSKSSIGFDKASFSFLYSSVIKYRDDYHEVRRNLSLIGYEKEYKDIPEINFSDSGIQKIQGLVNSNSKNIIIAPSTVWETKKYPSESFIEIGKYFKNEGFDIYIIGGEGDKEYCENIAMKIGGVRNLAGELTFEESILLIKNSKLIICNDSAPTHMAMLAKAAVLTIYCSTVPNFGFYPYSLNSSFIGLEDLDCKPCGIHGHNKCPKGTFECGINLTPDSVIKEAENLLKIENEDMI